MVMSTVPVIDSSLSFVDEGSGPPVLFLHGNPTSSYLWRNILPPLGRHGYRTLIGMGRSGSSGRGYRLADHLACLDAFLDALELRDLTLVGHDWGGVMALALARRHPERVTGVAILEAHLHPIESWSGMSVGDREMFSRLRADGSGERSVLDGNFFVEVVLPSGIMRDLTTKEHDRYREPFPDAASRMPILQWVREIPIAGQPADVAHLIVQNQKALKDPALPTLLMHGDPGAVIGAAGVAWCAEFGRATTITAVGAGTHFLPEDRPGEIVDALVAWLAGTSPPALRVMELRPTSPDRWCK